jgi:hypothetical protein
VSELARLGADAITSDDPRMVLGVLGETAAAVLGVGKPRSPSDSA